MARTQPVTDCMGKRIRKGDLVLVIFRGIPAEHLQIQRVTRVLGECGVWTEPVTGVEAFSMGDTPWNEDCLLRLKSLPAGLSREDMIVWAQMAGVVR